MAACGRTCQRQSRASLLPLMLAMMLLASERLRVAEAQATQWTFIGYIAADNSLDCFSMMNLAQMQVAMATASINGPAPDVYLLVDRGQGSCRGQDGASLVTSYWTSTKELALLPGGTWSEVRDWQEINTATPSTMTAFIKRALTRYPPTVTRKYMFLMWDHGAAYQGSGEDVACDIASSSSSMRACGWLTINSILTGLSAGLAGSGLSKFDLLSFDACLMGNVETISALTSVASSFVVSEHLVPGHGLDYGFLKSLITNPSASTDQLADSMLRTYTAMCKASGSYDCTMAYIRTAELQLLGDGLAAAASEWTTAMGVTNSLAELFLRALISTKLVYRDFDTLVDAGDFLANVAKVAAASVAKGGTEAQAAQLIVTRVSSLQQLYANAIHQYASYKADSKLTGLSLFFPSTASETSGESVWMTPLGQISTEVAAWYTFVSTVYSQAEKLLAPYQAILRAAGTYKPNVVGPDAQGNIQVQGDLGAPILLDGQLLYGFASPLTPSLNIVAGSAVADVSSASAVVGTFDGRLYGLQQVLPNGQNVSGLLLMEEDTSTVANSTTKRLMGSVFYAATCTTPIPKYKAATLMYSVDTVSGASSMALFAQESTIMESGTGDGALNNVLAQYYSASYYEYYDRDDTPEAQDDAEGEADASATSTRNIGSGSSWAQGPRPSTLEEVIDASMITPLLDGAQEAVEDVQDEAAGSDGSSSRRRGLLSRGAGFGAQIQGSRTVRVKQVGARAPGSGPYLSTGQSKALALSSMLLGGSGLSEVSPSTGGVLITALLNTHLNTTSNTSNIGFSFGYTACFKWGYNSTLKVVHAPMAAWESPTKPGKMKGSAVKVPLRRSWSATLVGSDLVGRTRSWLSVNAGSGGLPGGGANTTSGCTCKAEWYRNGVTYHGCALAPGFTSPMCEVLPGTCPSGASLATTPYDTCKPARTLAGCNCAASYTAGIGTSPKQYNGTCANWDATHPGGSWCTVDPTSCPSSSRAHGSSDTSWDYCAVKTALGCLCANSWVDPQGVTHTGDCVTEPDEQNPGSTVSWCATQQDAGSFVRPLAAYRQQADSCPYAWDYCTPPTGRSTTLSPSCPSPSCALPSLYQGVPMYNCINYNLSAPGQTFGEWCFTGSQQTAASMAPCTPATCSAPLLAACPPPSGASPSQIITCLDAMCNAELMTGSFDSQHCPFDTVAQLKQASSVYDASINSSVIQSVTGQPGYSGFSTWCNNTRGVACSVHLLFKYCDSVMWDGEVQQMYVDPSQDSCASTCVIAACQARQLLDAQPGCRDPEVTALVLEQLTLMHDWQCGYVPVINQCPYMVSEVPPVTYCPYPAALLNSSSGSIITTPSDRTTYWPGSACGWLIQPKDPSLIYITLTFTRFSTEENYDTLEIYDGNGMVGSFSGSSTTAIPTTITTDSGVFLLVFTSDDSMEGYGFSMTWSASAQDNSVPVPSCSSGDRLVSVQLALLAHASTVSWMVTSGRLQCSTANSTSLTGGQPTAADVLATGGSLPSGSSTLGMALAATAWPKNPRSYTPFRDYTAYVCLTPGTYNLYLMDSSGSGWSGSTISAMTGDGTLVNKASVAAGVYEACSVMTVPSGGTNRAVVGPVLGPSSGSLRMVLGGRGLSPSQMNGLFQSRLRESVAEAVQVTLSRVLISASGEYNPSTSGPAAFARRLAESQPISAPTGTNTDGDDDNSLIELDTLEALGPLMGVDLAARQQGDSEAQRQAIQGGLEAQPPAHQALLRAHLRGPLARLAGPGRREAVKMMSGSSDGSRAERGGPGGMEGRRRLQNAESRAMLHGRDSGGGDSRGSGAGRAGVGKTTGGAGRSLLQTSLTNKTSTNTYMWFNFTLIGFSDSQAAQTAVTTLNTSLSAGVLIKLMQARGLKVDEAFDPRLCPCGGKPPSCNSTCVTPINYLPPSSSSSDSDSKVPKALIIGLVAGLGGAALLATVLLVVIWARRSKQVQPSKVPEPVAVAGPPPMAYVPAQPYGQQQPVQYAQPQYYGGPAAGQVQYYYGAAGQPQYAPAQQQPYGQPMNGAGYPTM